MLRDQIEAARSSLTRSTDWLNMALAEVKLWDINHHTNETVRCLQQAVDSTNDARRLLDAAEHTLNRRSPN